MRRILPAPLLALGLILALAAPANAQFNPIGAIYDAARDERSVADITADKNISVGIKADLAKKDSKLALSVKVYCYMRRVTLLGQVPDEKFKEFAVATAKKAKGVKSVEAHWEAPTDTFKADTEIAARLRAALIADKSLSSTQVETEVFGGKVYLVGMVRTAQDAAKAQAIAKGVKGVTGVKSLLIPTRK